MVVTPKQKHLFTAPQGYHDARLKLATHRVHLKAICHAYDVECNHIFPDRNKVYCLYDQIISNQRIYIDLEEELAEASMRLKFSGDPATDAETVRDPETPLRKLYWAADASPLPSPPATPPRSDIWTMFRDTPISANDTTLQRPGRRVHFAELPESPQRRSSIQETVGRVVGGVVEKVGEIRDKVTTYWSPPRIMTSPVNTSKKRCQACDHYAQALSPAKKLKVCHEMNWPEAYTCNDLDGDVFEDCTTGEVDLHEPKEDIGPLRQVLSPIENATPSPEIRAMDKIITATLAAGVLDCVEVKP